MASHRMDRNSEDIRREIMAIMRTIKDPRVTECFVSVVRVEVTNDLSYCTVYVSTIEGIEKTNDVVKGLKSASGYIRRQLGLALKLRHTPQLIFKASDSIEYSANINKIIENLDIPKGDAEDE